LGALAVLASIGFGWWLIEEPHSSRELLLAMVAWVLGFWVAAGVRPPAGRVERHLEEGGEGDDDWDEEE